MKKTVLTFAVTFLALSGLATAAEPEYAISLWGRNAQASQDYQAFPWVTYDGDLSVDARYNFDEPNTGAVLIGKRFGHPGWTITPSAGVLFGKHPGQAVQLVSIMSLTDRLSVMGWLQYVWTEAPAKDYAYVWSDWTYRLHPKFALGVSGQLCAERGQERFVDVGPFIKVGDGKHTSAKFWVTWDPHHSGHRKAFVGLTYAK